MKIRCCMNIESIKAHNTVNGFAIHSYFVLRADDSVESVLVWRGLFSLLPLQSNQILITATSGPEISIIANSFTENSNFSGAFKLNEFCRRECRLNDDKIRQNYARARCAGTAELSVGHIFILVLP